jgi:hypothetical protein
VPRKKPKKLLVKKRNVAGCIGSEKKKLVRSEKMKRRSVDADVILDLVSEGVSAVVETLVVADLVAVTPEAVDLPATGDE